MFSLIWSHDKNISNAVTSAFKRICLKIDEENKDEKSDKLISKRIIEKLLDKIDLNLSLTFEHILKQLFNESNSTPTSTNFFSFIEILIDYYLKLTIDNSKKNLSEEFFKQIQQRQSSFLQLISFVIPYDNKHRLTTHLNSIVQSLIRRIDKDDLDYFRYQIQILGNLLTTKTSYEIPIEFYDLIIAKLLNSSIETNQNSWINCMKELLNILFLKEPKQISTNDFLMKFLRSLADQINWPLENSDYQSKLNDNSWRKIFIRLLATINTLLTHRLKKYEYINISSIKKNQKEKNHLNHNDDDEHDFHHEKPLKLSSPPISRQLFDDEDDDDEKIDNEEDIQHDLHLMQQQHSDLTQLEQELIQPNSLFYSIEKWFETVRKANRYTISGQSVRTQKIDETWKQYSEWNVSGFHRKFSEAFYSGYCFHVPGIFEFFRVKSAYFLRLDLDVFLTSFV
jgi:hypothetical protein